MAQEPPQEAVEAVQNVLGCEVSAWVFAAGVPMGTEVCSVHHTAAVVFGGNVSGRLAPWTAEGCSVAAAVVAALDLPARDREVAAKALDEAAAAASSITCGYPNAPHIRSLMAIRRWLRSRAAELRKATP